MSVTFTAELGPVVGYAITCGCADATERAPRYGSHDDAVAELRVIERGVEAGLVNRAALPGCQMPDVCPDYQLMVDEIEQVKRPEINVHKGNAKLLLDALGYETDETGQGSGTAEPDDFQGRVLTALAVAPADEGMPAHEAASVEVAHDPMLAALCVPGGTGKVYYGGRRPGYLQDMLGRLHELADWCREHNRLVQWA